MRSLTLSGVLFVLALSWACSSSVPDDVGMTRPAPEPTAPVRPPERIDPVLESELKKIVGTVQAKVGVGAVLLETGDSAWIDRNGRYASQSVYKLPIAMAVMKLVEEGRVRIDQEVTITPDDYVRRGFHSPIRNLYPAGTVLPVGVVVNYSISDSDGTASDVLLDLAGGPAAVQNYLAGFGITDFIVADSEKSISKDWETQYRNWATPQASIDLLRALIDRRAGLSRRTTDILLWSMTESSSGRNRLKRGLPAGTVLAHKTGTGGRASEVPGASKEDIARASVERNTNSNANSNIGKTAKRKKAEASKIVPITSATNDIGIITLPDGRHILIAVYVMDSPEDAPTREKLIADIARAVCMRWAASLYDAEPANAGNKAVPANASP